MITQPARDLVERHRAAGDVCVIITATNSFVTAPIAREFGVEHLIATEPEHKDGEFTGNVADVPCFREGKITRLENWLAAARLEHGQLRRQHVLQRFIERFAVARQGEEPGGGESGCHAARACRTARLENCQPELRALLTLQSRFDFQTFGFTSQSFHQSEREIHSRAGAARGYQLAVFHYGGALLHDMRERIE